MAEPSPLYRKTLPCQFPDSIGVSCSLPDKNLIEMSGDSYGVGIRLVIPNFYKQEAIVEP